MPPAQLILFCCINTTTMRFALSLLLLLNSFFLFAQDFSVSLSNEIDFKPGSVPLKMGNEYVSLSMDAKSQFGYTFKLSKVKYSIELSKYGSDMKLIKSYKLAGGEKLYGPFPPVLKKLYGKLWLFYYQLSGEEGNSRLFAAPVDIESLTTGDPQELLALNQKNVGLFGTDVFNRYALTLKPSPDKTKMLVLWNSGTTNEVFFSVVSDDLKVIRRAVEKISDKDQIHLSGASVDNDGTVFITYRFKEKKETDGRLLVNRQGAPSKDIAITVTNGFTGDVFVETVENNQLVLAGTYKDKNYYLAGAFSASLSADLKQGKAVEMAFPVELVKQFEKEGWADDRAKKYGLYESFISLQSFLLEDGTLNLSGEFRKIAYGTKTSFMVAGSVLNIRIKEGRAIFSRVPKIRVSAGRTIGDSYYTFPYKDAVVVLYNDHASNLAKPITEEASRSDNYKNSVLVAAIIAADGNVERFVAMDQSKEDYLAFTEDIHRQSISSFLIPCWQIKGFGKPTDNFKWAVLEMK